MTTVVKFHEVGGPEVMRFEKSEVGNPGPGQVRLRHVAVGLNFADTYFRSGIYPVPLPSGLGNEASGVVEAVGEGVQHLKVGDRVTYTGFTNTLGAYSTEIIRAGIQVTPKGQWEAGRVLGLTRLQAFIRVVLPPALQRIYPALVSQCIIVMLGSSVVSQVSYEELTFAANLIQSRTFLSFEVYLVTTGIYLALSITLRQLMMTAGRK